MSFLEAVRNPSILHAMVVHVPITLAVLGAPLVLLALVLPRWRGVLWCAIAVYALATVSAYAAMHTGAEARHVVPPTVSEEAYALLDAHERVGETVWIAALVTTVLLAVGLIRHPRVRVIALGLALASSLGAAGLVGLTAHRGGTLVYRYGIGTDLIKQEAAPETIEEPVAEPDDVDPAAEPEPEPEPDAEPEPEPEPDAAAGEITFVADIVPVIEQHCLPCHEAPDPRGDLALTRYEGFFEQGRKAGPAVIAGEPDESAIVQYIEGTLRPRMPHKEDPLPDDVIRMIRDWIAAGAPEE